MLSKYQKGVGLLEVLIALLLLAIAVLGFSFMQLRAIQATNETLTRSDVMAIVRNVSEDLRLYPTDSQKQAYINAITSGSTTSTKDCKATACTESEQINYNAAQALLLAQSSDIRVSADWCPDTQGDDLRKICLIASWDKTEPTMNGDKNACLKSSGVYVAGASCIVMETY